MTVWHTDSDLVLYHGDCIEILNRRKPESLDAIVTDPPYGLGFMGKEWDALPPGKEWAEACLRALKPGGHLLAFGGRRTWHRLAVAIEDAGFEIRDSIAWLYGSGFPKSLDVSKAIDKAAGSVNGDFSKQIDENGYRYTEVTAPATDAAKQWQGWGTALKPTFEPIIMARRPLVGTVAANVLAHGTGGLNIDATRMALAPSEDVQKLNARSGGRRGFANAYVGGDGQSMPLPPGADLSKGRWPTNVALDEGQADALGDTSRFFYVAKASAKERPKVDGVSHPTVKPLTLMRWLVRLVTPPSGIVCDPFLGSGTTAEAARLEGFRCIGIENDETYLPLIAQRLGLPDLTEAA